MSNTDIQDAEPDEILRIDDVKELTKLSESTIRRLEQNGDFPSRRSISAHRVGWLRSEVYSWMSDREKVHL